MNQPTKIDQRRLRDGAAGLALPTDDLGTLSVTALKQRYSQLHDAGVAMQSLDDLGTVEANQRAWDDMTELFRRFDAVKAELKRRGETQ
jgi:hypothetical protein